MTLPEEPEKSRIAAWYHQASSQNKEHAQAVTKDLALPPYILIQTKMEDDMETKLEQGLTEMEEQQKQFVYIAEREG